MTLLGCRGVTTFQRNLRRQRRIERAWLTRPNAFTGREYLIEAGAIGTFMVSAAAFAAVLYHPSSPAAGTGDRNELLRRGLMGLAMGATAVAIIYSPWGQRSGAHMNPAVTLTFFRLGKVARPDLIGYVAAQFAGAIVGIAVAAAALRRHRLGSIGQLRHDAAGDVRRRGRVPGREPRSRSC